MNFEFLISDCGSGILGGLASLRAVSRCLNPGPQGRGPSTTEARRICP